jgi:gliding motility-associated-like protein
MKMKRLCLTLTVLFLFGHSFGQAVNYELEIVHFRMTGCSDSDGSDGDEDPTWKIWGRDNDGVPSFTGGTCYHDESDIPITYIPGGSLAIYPTQMNSNATTIQFQLEAWEEDGSALVGCDNDDCVFTDCSIWNSDDDHQLFSSGTYNFRDSSACEWHTITISAGCFAWSARFRWEYSVFDAGPLVQDACGDSVVMSGSGSGEWSILSGGTGGFSSNSDPTATFGGVVGNTYTLQWATFPDCITPVTQDIQVTLNTLPDPNLSTTSVVFCEFSTIDFLASNGLTYDWCLNSTGNIVHDDTVAGAYNLTNTSLNDSIVYVFVTDADGCVGLDSLAFTVEVSPSVEIGNDTTICDGGSILLDATDGVPFTGYSWNTSETTPTLNITAPGQYIITLTHTNSCTNSDTINIGYYSPTNLALGGTQVMCLGDSVTIDAGAGYVSYLWDDLSINQTNTFFSFGTYNVTVTDTNNCSISDSVVVDPDYFFYSLGADTTISLGAAIDLTANPGISYVWNTSETTQTITVSPSVDDVFTATTLLANGCYEVGTINVFISEDLNIFIPNMFSPNGDGNNDAFMLYGFGLAEVDFRIFNRWGHEVWSTTDVLELQTMGWDGKSNSDDQPSGTYVWKMTGTTITGAPLSFNGNNQGTILLRR